MLERDHVDVLPVVERLENDATCLVLVLGEQRLKAVEHDSLVAVIQLW